MDADGADIDDNGSGEAEVIVSEAAVDVVDPSEQDQPEIGGVEIISDESAGISLIPDAADGDEQPEITQL